MAKFLLLCCLAIAFNTGYIHAGESTGDKEFFLKYRLAFRIADEFTCWGRDTKLMEGKSPFSNGPKFLSAKPLFGSFRLGDKTANNAATYDILYFDANGDGLLSAKEKIAPLPGRNEIAFGPIRIQVNYGCETAAQNFVFAYSTLNVQSRDDPRKNELGRIGSWWKW